MCLIIRKVDYLLMDKKGQMIQELQERLRKQKEEHLKLTIQIEYIKN